MSRPQKRKKTTRPSTDSAAVAARAQTSGTTPAGGNGAAKLTLPRLLLVGAMLISGYLAINSLSNGGIPGCGPGGGCDEVLHSRWSRWFGIPVSIPAFLLDLALVLATLKAAARTSTKSLGRWRLFIAS